MKVYTYRNCGACRNAVRWLRAHDIAFGEIPIRDQPPSPAELRFALGWLGGEVRRLCNTSGSDYREMGLKDKLATMGEDELLGLLSGNGNLVKRPFVIAEGFALAGFKEEEWRKAFETGPS